MEEKVELLDARMFQVSEQQMVTSKVTEIPLNAIEQVSAFRYTTENSEAAC